MRVLRIAHHAVMTPWRERERQLRLRGEDVLLISARQWNEGGRTVAFEAEGDAFVTPVGTLGSHPNGFVYDPRPLWRMLGARPDLIDLHEEPVSLATAEVLLLRALRRPRVPYVLYSAQNLDKRYPLPFRWLEKRALQSAAGAYVCNREAAEILIRKGLRGPAVFIPLGVDTADFTPAAKAGPAPEPIIGYIGRLERYKGVDLLLRSAAERPRWRLEITGAGPEGPALRRLAESLGIADRTTFLDFAVGAELAARYRRLDVVAVPSVPWPGWREQFCRVAVEAMASGVPVVASRTGALPDVLADAGELVEPGNPGSLAEGIDRVLQPDRWSSFRDAGIRRSDEFSWSRIAQLQQRFYADVTEPVGSGGGRSPQVVVVAYGDPDLLAGALEALEREFAITIVDNSGNSATRALAERAGAAYIDAGRNAGFGGGVNLALTSLAERGLQNDDVLLLNPDARIVSSDVHRLHRRLHSARGIAAVGATQSDPETGHDVRVWWPFPTPRRAWLDACALGRLDRSHGFAIGSVLLLRAEAIARVGRFDERFFLYAEEADWQKRAIDDGWRIDVVATGATHVGAGTSTDGRLRDALFFASTEIYQRKHSGRIGWQSFRAAMVLGALARALVLSGSRRRAALLRARIFWMGPVRYRNERFT